MDNLKRRLEACKGEPDWATFPLDESLLQDMPPLSAEARADHEQGMNFFKRLEVYHSLPLRQDYTTNKRVY